MQRFWFLFIFLCPAVMQAQLNANFFKDGDYLKNKEFPDSLAFSVAINDILYQWVEQGHFFAGVDSAVVFDDQLNVYLHQGKAYQLKSPDFRRKGVRAQLNKKMKQYANHGYPFASLRVDSLGIEGEALNARLWVSTGPEIRYDSAFFFQQTRTKPAYIYQLLDIVPGDLFSESNYRRLEKKMRRSSFMELGRPTDISFKSNEATIFLDVEENSSGSFEGIFGLQQVEGGQTTAVGSLDLTLENLFRSGKELKIFWERFSEESQHLFLAYKHPFLLGSRISPMVQFDLLKQDTSFLTRTTGVGLYTFIGSNTEILLAYEGVSGSLLTSDLELIRQSSFADFERRLYTIELENGSRADLRRRTNSFGWKGHVSMGKKQVQRNLNLPATFYDTVQLATDFYRLEASIVYQRKVWERQSLFQEVSGGWVENDELLSNELYRLGGLSSLRGFNEKQLFASKYLLSRMEFRSFFERESYFFLFYDQLIYEREDRRDYPFGFGLGFALNTSSGQFTFALGSGKSKDQPLSFSSLKAHFGYISRF